MTSEVGASKTAKLERRARRISTALAIFSIVASFLVAGPGCKTATSLWTGYYWPEEPWVFSEQSRIRINALRGPVAQQVRSFTIGWERTAPLCCAMWATLGLGNALVRFSSAVACLGALACFASHRAADDAVGLYIGVFAIYCTLLAALRWSTGARMVDARKSVADHRDKKLGLADLFVITGCFAVLASAVQAAIPWNDMPPSELLVRLWRHVTSFVVWGFDAVLLLPALVIAIVILGQLRRPWLALATLVTAIAVTPALTAVIRDLLRGRVLLSRFDYTQIMLTHAMVSCGFVAGACFAASVMRVAGFRLCRPSRGAAP